MNKEKLKEQIKLHEGEVLEIYEDSLGYATLGVGHLIKEDDPEFDMKLGTPISQEVVDKYFDEDFDKHLEETYRVCENANIDFDKLPEDIQHVLVDMCFNLGPTRLSKFKNMLKACSQSDWKEMAVQMVNSRWFIQVKSRGKTLRDIVLSHAS